MEEIKIFEKDENGRLTVSDQAAQRLKEIDEQVTILNNEENLIRHEILEGMIQNQIDKCSTLGMTFTQVMPKPKGTFDVDAFFLNESEDIIKCFTTFEEEEEFDIERFKSEKPELYMKYLNKNIITNVDVKKMEKTLTPVFKKYWHEEPSDKPTTLRITTKKGE